MVTTLNVEPGGYELAIGARQVGLVRVRAQELLVVLGGLGVVAGERLRVELGFEYMARMPPVFGSSTTTDPR